MKVYIVKYEDYYHDHTEHIYGVYEKEADAEQGEEELKSMYNVGDIGTWIEKWDVK